MVKWLAGNVRFMTKLKVIIPDRATRDEKEYDKKKIENICDAYQEWYACCWSGCCFCCRNKCQTCGSRHINLYINKN